METTFRPGLMSRLFTEASKNIIKKAHDYNIPVQKSVISGGYNTANSIDVSFTQAFNVRAFLKLYILLISMYLAAYTITNPIINELLLIMRIDTKKLVKDPENFKGKYLVLFVLLLLFSLFSWLYNMLIYKIVFWSIYGYYELSDNKGLPSIQITQLKYDDIFEFFGSRLGPGSMDFFSTITSFVIFCLPLILIIYMFFVKSFINKMDYPNYAGDNEKEHPVERKFLFTYIITAIYIVLMMIGLFAVYINGSEYLVIITTLLAIGVFAIFATFAIQKTLRREFFQSLMFLLILFGLIVSFFLYGY